MLGVVSSELVAVGLRLIAFSFGVERGILGGSVAEFGS